MTWRSGISAQLYSPLESATVHSLTHVQRGFKLLTSTTSAKPRFDSWKQRRGSDIPTSLRRQEMPRRQDVHRLDIREFDKGFDQ